MAAQVVRQPLGQRLEIATETRGVPPGSVIHDSVAQGPGERSGIPLFARHGWKLTFGTFRTEEEHRPTGHGSESQKRLQ